MPPRLSLYLRLRHKPINVQPSRIKMLRCQPFSKHSSGVVICLFVGKIFPFAVMQFCRVNFHRVTSVITTPPRSDAVFPACRKHHAHSFITLADVRRRLPAHVRSFRCSVVSPGVRAYFFLPADFVARLPRLCFITQRACIADILHAAVEMMCFILHQIA